MHSKGNEYCFELAGTSNYQSLNYCGPTVCDKCMYEAVKDNIYDSYIDSNVDRN